ncbi:cell cycle-related kinase [Achlya hypogyna]|uniref:Cyclin-dependent kinase 2 homolog n=1 Tax=Achlya hypogyna TaxID=1202772 RepID=A0A1V9ZBE3_ACHHY|nr:cell cycle-related kinase [Achlya hypogyna]
MLDRPFEETYELLERLGHGNFGEVHRIREVATGRVLALKRIRVGGDAERMELVPSAAFNEIQAMEHLSHPNIVQLLQVIPEGASVGLVLEYMDTDLAKLMARATAPFTPSAVKSLLFMLLRGVEYCHRCRIMHRDLKPSNLLVGADGVLKLSDFGLATVYTGPAREYSHTVATRWYRAPELLFGSRSYDPAVDLWSVGVIFAELLQHAPLFPGLNDIDQLFRVLQVLGSPAYDGLEALPDYHKVSFPAFKPIPLSRLFPDTSPDALDLLAGLLAYDPKARLTATQALQHAYFSSHPPPSPRIPAHYLEGAVDSQNPAKRGGDFVPTLVSLDLDIGYL